MAQLSDDCFAFGGPMLRVDEAIALIRARVQPVAEVETVPLSVSDQRVLAETVLAGRPVPPFDNSAVDGYAVRHADLAASGESRLPVSGRLPAGAGNMDAIRPGTAVRIFTGAPMPEGADTVFMQEDVRVDGGFVILPAGLKAGANRRFAGEDFASGAIVLAEGTRLDPRRVAALAAIGLPAVSVRRRVRVALFSTGTEIVEPGSPLGSAQQFDANRTMLAALLRRRGVEVLDLGILPDDRDTIAASLGAAASRVDLILTSGGVSTGEEDHVKAAVESVGRLTFWRIAIKPGRPVALGTIAGAAFVGLPGNPVASFVTFVNVAAPLIDRLAGAAPSPVTGFPVAAEFSYRKKAGRREYVRAALATAAQGGLVARKYPREGAALIGSLIATDGLVELQEDVTDIVPGATVTFLPYGSLY